MSVEELLCKCLDFIEGGGPVTDLWSEFKQWMQEKGWELEDLELAAKEACRTTGRLWEGLE